ncbi:MAG: hypothetical protein D6748_01270 [Calditrichaeota bacterium]|nr:MAG: hypothetical protein D6748_01270 [Calditrichota bacterium]
MMNRWASDYEFVIIDTHTGLSEWNVGIMQASKIIYIITVEEPTSIIDTYGFLKASRLFLPVEKFQLIINQVRNPNQGKEAHQKLNQALEHFQKFSIALAGVVEFDEQLREAIQQQTPLWEAGFDGIALQTVAKIVTQSLKLTVVESSD